MTLDGPAFRGYVSFKKGSTRRIIPKIRNDGIATMVMVMVSPQVRWGCGYPPSKLGEIYGLQMGGDPITTGSIPGSPSCKYFQNPRNKQILLEVGSSPGKAHVVLRAWYVRQGIPSTSARRYRENRNRRESWG